LAPAEKHDGRNCARRSINVPLRISGKTVKPPADRCPRPGRALEIAQPAFSRLSPYARTTDPKQHQLGSALADVTRPLALNPIGAALLFRQLVGDFVVRFSVVIVSVAGTKARCSGFGRSTECS
jgi:hypothetical protein